MAEGRGVAAFYDEFEVRQTTRVYLFHTVSCTIQKSDYYCFYTCLLLCRAHILVDARGKHFTTHLLKYSVRCFQAAS